MKRFCHQQSHPLRKQACALILFLCAGILFCTGILRLSHETDANEKEILYAATWRSIIHCYSMDGRYPESLDELIEKYGIQYDTDKFFIDYQALGSNLMPDVTIIDKRASAQED
jgi:ABC-type uncharacterized transport system involved in gliding motility auxiliary subunit